MNEDWRQGISVEVDKRGRLPCIRGIEPNLVLRKVEQFVAGLTMVVFSCLWGCSSPKTEPELKSKSERAEQQLESKQATHKSESEQAIESLKAVADFMIKNENRSFQGIFDVSYDVRTTDSLVSPYVGILRFSQKLLTGNHDRFELNFAWKEGQWVPNGGTLWDGIRNKVVTLRHAYPEELKDDYREYMPIEAQGQRA